jgi:hypothetical protein
LAQTDARQESFIFANLFLGLRFGNIKTMDPVRHFLYRRPWPEDAHFIATRAFLTSWATTAAFGLS